MVKIIGGSKVFHTGSQTFERAFYLVNSMQQGCGYFLKCTDNEFEVYQDQVHNYQLLPKGSCNWEFRLSSQVPNQAVQIGEKDLLVGDCVLFSEFGYQGVLAVVVATELYPFQTAYGNLNINYSDQVCICTLPQNPKQKAMVKRTTRDRLLSLRSVFLNIGISNEVSLLWIDSKTHNTLYKIEI